MKHLIIGLGQVGSGVQKVLECEGHDPSRGIEAVGQFDVIHICFPFDETFTTKVNSYKEIYGADYVVIHSTVPVGTSSSCGAVHSPIRGVHPYLEQSIRTFVKYFGGKDAEIMAQEFRNKGVTCETTEKSETTELAKLVDTTTYGLNILIEKEIYELSKKFDTDYDLVYNRNNLTYNKGYTDLGSPQFSKYNIKHMDGKIGGHCIMQNAELLDSWLTQVLKDKNELYGN